MKTTFAQFKRLQESATRKAAHLAEITAAGWEQEWIEMAQNDLAITQSKLSQAQKSLITPLRHYVAQEGMWSHLYAMRVFNGYLLRDGKVIEVAGVEAVSDKSVRIFGTVLGSGETYKELRRADKQLCVYTIDNIVFPA